MLFHILLGECGNLADSIFSKLRALMWKIAGLAYLTPEFCRVRVFMVCRRQRGRALEVGRTPEKRTSVRTGAATSSTKKSLRLPKKSEVRQTYLLLKIKERNQFTAKIYFHSLTFTLLD